MKEKIKSIALWALVIVIVGYLMGQLYLPLFASAEITGRNTVYILASVFVIWKAYRLRHPKVKEIKVQNE